MSSKYKYSIILAFVALYSLLLWSCQSDDTEDLMATDVAYEEIEVDNVRILTVAPAEEDSTGCSIVIFPGGAYSNVCWDSEGLNWAKYFADQGLMVYIVDYHLPDGNPEIPIQDGLTALQYVRTQTPNGCVGIVGCSAGGHLAAHLSTSSSEDLRPDFQILFYPVICMDWTYTHYVTRTSLLGNTEDYNLIRKYSPAQNIDALTPPAFIAVCEDDDLVAPINSQIYHSALTDFGISSVLKIYPKGGHGWSEAGFPSMQSLKNELAEWMKIMIGNHKRIFSQYYHEII